jgi:membrane associated rhomboid family serine protease
LRLFSPMDRYGQSSYSDEHQPVTWIRGYPVYAAHFIVAVYVVSMLVTVTLNAAGVAWHNTWLPFFSEEVLRGQIWRVLTYGLINVPDLQFRWVLDLVMMAFFGREVEKAWGRRTFLGFYATIYLISPLLLTAIGRWMPWPLAGETGALAIFVAFATLYPGALMMFNILAKWAAIIIVSIYALIYVNDHAWAPLICLAATCGFAYAFVRHYQGHFSLPDFKFWKRRPKLRVLPDLPAKPAGKAASAPLTPKGTSMAEVDALLDKIAQSGYASLTAKERAKLDSARADMLKRDAKRAP